MKVAVIGLGKMGSQIVKRFIDNGHGVVVLDPSPRAVANAVSLGAENASGRSGLIKKFVSEKVILWLMIPAQFVSDEINQWVDLLPSGSIVIDGGNTDFRQTKKHANLLINRAVDLIDIGTSGGILGEKNGFSMMVGGEKKSYEHIKPLLEAMSNPRGGYEYFGESGSGHYVKMVHNAIEYGMMESLAEGYHMLKEGPYKDLDLASAGKVWQRASVIESTLNELCAQIMLEDQNMSGVSGYVAESGEAKWTLEIAKESGVDMPVIETSLEVRRSSEQGNVSYTTKLLARLRNKFGGHEVNAKK